MKIKTADLTGPALDWAVAKCQLFFGDIEINGCVWWKELPYLPSTDWAQGGPIKEREGIATRRSKGIWYAMLSSDLGDGERAQWCEYTWRGLNLSDSKPRPVRFKGETELQATMRCYVASKLGDEVDVPDELVQP